MTAPFLLVSGSLFAGTALTFAWGVRQTHMPILAKLALVSAAVGAACLIPFTQARLESAPRFVTLDDLLSPCFELVAMAPNDAGNSVDLWLAGQVHIARLSPLTKDVIETLSEAREDLASGKPYVRLCRKSQAEQETSEGSGRTAASQMEIDHSLFAQPRKQ